MAQQGLLGSIAHGVGGLLSLPFNVAEAYSAGYAQLPQRYRDEAQLRQLKLKEAQAMAPLRQQAMAGLFDAFGGGVPQQPQTGVQPAPEAATPQPQGRPVPSIRDLASPLARAALAGVDVGDLVNVLDKTAPQIDVANGVTYDKRGTAPGTRIGVNLQPVNGTLVDPNDTKNVNRFIPKVPDGAVPLYDQSGNVVATKLLDGTIQAVGALAGAEAGAKKAAEAPYSFESVPMPDGSTMLASQRDLVRGLLPPGAGRSQSPSAARMSEAADAASLDLPNTLQQANTALELIDSLKAHPALKMRTGGWSMVPAMPGTSGADFDAMSSQLQGKVFLEAYASLKGGGAISEPEGKAATQAIGRLNSSQTAEGYVKALDDLKAVIAAGAQRVASRAAAAPAAVAPAGGYSRAQLEAEARRRGIMR